VVAGPDFNSGAMTQTTLVLTVDDTPPDQRLSATGLFLLPEDDRMLMEEPMLGTGYAEPLQSFDFYSDPPVELVQVEQPRDRLPAEIFYLPALLLLGAVILFQRRRQTQPAF